MKIRKNLLVELAILFTKIGCISFGGPAAHIAILEDEIIEKRKWLTKEHFLDLIGATNLIPGPNSTEMTMHIGYERAGFQGLLVSGFCFILPSVCITAVLGYLYTKYGQLPEIEQFIYGIKPAVISIVAISIYKLGQKAIKNWQFALLAFFCFLLCLIQINEIAALFITGILGAVFFHFKNSKNLAGMILYPLTSTKIFWIFLKVGAVLYGGGYFLFALLEQELVAKDYLNTEQLLDAIAVGQFTPGPILSTATFVGFQLNGIEGAIAATIGIFLPSFILVWVLNPQIAKVSKIPFLRHLLDAINVSALAIMAYTLISMTKSALTDWKTILIALLGISLSLAFKKMNVSYLVIGGAVLGYLLTFIKF